MIAVMASIAGCNLLARSQSVQYSCLCLHGQFSPTLMRTESLISHLFSQKKKTTHASGRCPPVACAQHANLNAALHSDWPVRVIHCRTLEGWGEMGVGWWQFCSLPLLGQVRTPGSLPCVCVCVEVSNHGGVMDVFCLVWPPSWQATRGGWKYPPYSLAKYKKR